MPEHLWISMRLRKWENIEINNTPIKATKDFPDGGWLGVFRTRHAALKDAKGAGVIEIETKDTPGLHPVNNAGRRGCA